MYSIIGLLKKPDGMTTEDFTTWWLGEHVPKVLAVPGLRDYRLWTVSELLDHSSLEFSADTPYDGVAVITFDSKADFEASFASSQGSADAESFNAGAPSSTVFSGEYYVFRDSGIPMTQPPSSA